MSRNEIDSRLHRLRTRVRVVRRQVQSIRESVALRERFDNPEDELVIQLGESVEALNVAMRCLRH